MNNRSSQFSTSRLVLIFIAGIAAGGIIIFAIFFFIQNGFHFSFGSANDAKNMPATAVRYGSVPQFVNNRVSLPGYVILANQASNVCGSAGWSTCELWFSDDPFNNGLGKHQVKITIGNGRDSITQSGDLYDHYGGHLSLVQTDQFSWYHVTISGIVEQCQSDKCVIDVDTITALQ